MKPNELKELHFLNLVWTRCHLIPTPFIGSIFRWLCLSFLMHFERSEPLYLEHKNPRETLQNELNSDKVAVWCACPSIMCYTNTSIMHQIKEWFTIRSCTFSDFQKVSHSHRIRCSGRMELDLTYIYGWWKLSGLMDLKKWSITLAENINVRSSTWVFTLRIVTATVYWNPVPSFSQAWQTITIPIRTFSQEKLNSVEGNLKILLHAVIDIQVAI